MPLRSLREYEQLAGQAYGHLCAGQIRGIRMALCGLNLLALADPSGGGRTLGRETARARAGELCPEIPPGNLQSRNQQQMRAYRDMSDEDLFAVQCVRVTLAPEDIPGYKAPRAFWAQFGEAVSFRREVARDKL